MSDSQRPHSDFVTLRSTVERIGEHASTPELQQLCRQLAEQLEQAIRRVNNNAGAVIGNVEIGLSNRLDDLARQLSALSARLDERYTESATDRAELHKQIEQVLGLLQYGGDTDA